MEPNIHWCCGRSFCIIILDWYTSIYVSNIPLGGNRCSKLKHLRNLLIVWALTGFWHGASWNFIFWGLYFAVILIAEKYFLLKILDKIPSFFRHVYTIFLVMISWAIFYFENLNELKNYLLGMFGFGGIPLFNQEGLYYLLSYGVIFVLAAYFSTPHLKKVINFTEKTTKRYVFICGTFVYAFVFLICVAYLVDSTYNPFLYFRF